MRNSETPERPDRPTRRPTFTWRRLIAGGGALAAGMVAGGPNIAWAMPKQQVGGRPNASDSWPHPVRISRVSRR